MKITLFGGNFTVTWWGLSLYAVLLSVLCSLGNWQWGRAEQKRQFLAQQQAMQALPPLNLNLDMPQDVDAMRYRSTRVRGHYDTEHQFLLDNQILDGKSGYFVLTPFILDGAQRAVLVNRGWIPANSDRRQLPDIAFSANVLEVQGRINRFPSLGIKLQGVEIPGEGWPSLLQWVDHLRVSDKLGTVISDFQIELEANADHGFRRDWKIQTAISPEKHQAYAVQWFGLALALTGLFIWFSFEKRRDEHAT